MDNSVIVALITGGCTVIGVVITSLSSNAKIAAQLEKAQGITDNNLANIKEDMKNLTDEVRRHNSFGDRITALEVQLRDILARQDRLDSKILRIQDGETK